MFLRSNFTWPNSSVTMYLYSYDVYARTPLKASPSSWLQGLYQANIYEGKLRILIYMNTLPFSYYYGTFKYNERNLRISYLAKYVSITRLAKEIYIISPTGASTSSGIYHGQQPSKSLTPPGARSPPQGPSPLKVVRVSARPTPRAGKCSTHQ